MEKVVAAMLVPASHQGSDRPDTKKPTSPPEAQGKHPIDHHNGPVNLNHSGVPSNTAVILPSPTARQTPPRRCAIALAPVRRQRQFGQM
jgi:hypothetical protein